MASEDFDPSRLTERQQLAYFAAKSEGKLELSPFRLDRLMVDNFDDSVCTAKIGNVRIKDLMNSSSKNRRQKKINSVDQTIAVTDSRHDSSNFDEKKSVFAKNRIENCESIFESIVDECVMTDNVLVENVSVLSTSHSFDTFDSLMMDNFCSDRIDIFDSDVEYLNQNGTESSHQNLVEVFSACKDNSLKMGETSSENLKTTTSFIAQVAECQLVSMNKIIQDAEKNELYFDLHQNPCNALSAADYRLPELDNCIHPSYPTDQKEHQEVYRDICHAAVYIPEKNKEPNLLEFALLKFHQSYLEIRARREEIAKIDGAKSKCST